MTPAPNADDSAQLAEDILSALDEYASVYREAIRIAADGAPGNVDAEAHVVPQHAFIECLLVRPLGTLAALARHQALPPSTAFPVLPKTLQRDSQILIKDN